MNISGGLLASWTLAIYQVKKTWLERHFIFPHTPIYSMMEPYKAKRITSLTLSRGNYSYIVNFPEILLDINTSLFALQTSRNYNLGPSQKFGQIILFVT